MADASNDDDERSTPTSTDVPDNVALEQKAEHAPTGFDALPNDVIVSIFTSLLVERAARAESGFELSVMQRDKFFFPFSGGVSFSSRR